MVCKDRKTIIKTKIKFGILLKKLSIFEGPKPKILSKEVTKSRQKAKDGIYMYLSAISVLMGIIFKTGSNEIKNQSMQKNINLLFFIVFIAANKITNNNINEGRTSLLNISSYIGIIYMVDRLIGKNNN